MDKDAPVPLPDSDELKKLVTLRVLRGIYGFLYERRDDPPTMTEIRDFVSSDSDEPQTQTDRRVRQLYRVFDIEVKQAGKVHTYRLAGWAKKKRGKTASSISGRIRAQVLAPAKCMRCGWTPAEDGVKLVVDHIVPQAWDGSDELENLQPLCQECNGGKQSTLPASTSTQTRSRRQRTTTNHTCASARS